MSKHSDVCAGRNGAPAHGKHTPGPWFVSRKHEVGPRSKEDDQSNGMIVPLADVYGDNRNQDARLIAAAPDMLAALKAAYPWIETSAEGEKATKVVLSAIARATGAA